MCVILRDATKTSLLPHSTYYVLHIYFSAKTYISGIVKLTHHFSKAEKVSGLSACANASLRYETAE